MTSTQAQALDPIPEAVRAFVAEFITDDLPLSVWTPAELRSLCERYIVRWNRRAALPTEASEPVGLEKLLAEADDFAERMTSQPWACELIEQLAAIVRARPAPVSSAVPVGDELEPGAQAFMDMIDAPATDRAAIIEECAKIIDRWAKSAEAENVTLRPDGLFAIAKELRALIGGANAE